MKKRKKLWIALFALVALAAALVVPGSPLNVVDSWNDGRHGGRSTKAWVRDLTHADAGSRLAAIEAVGKIGPDAGEAVPELARILANDPDSNARVQASFAMSKLGPASRGAVAELAAALKDDETLVRFNAARTLHRLGTEARPALPAMLAALKDDTNHTDGRTYLLTVHQFLLRAVGPVGAGLPDAVPVLVEHLAPTQPSAARTSAVASLRDIGEPARSAAPALRLMLADPDAEIRLLAEETLIFLGEPLAGTVADVESDKFELPEADRKYLWKIENAGNVLVKHGFGPLANALKDADRAALAKFLATDFTASDLREPKVVRTASGPLDVERIEDSGKPAIALDREAFLDRLLAFRRTFHVAAPGVKFNMMTLSPQTYGDLESKTWIGAVQLRLHGESEKGAPAEIVAVLRYEIVRPLESDLKKDGWIRRAEFVQVQTAKCPRPLFADATKERGLRVDKLYDNWKDGRFVSSTGGAFVTDFDRDGRLDLLVTDYKGPALYRGGPGGTFTDVTAAVGLISQAPEVTGVWVDLDGDGWDDLILGRRVYRNDGGRRFEDFTVRCKLRMPDRFDNVVVADYDRDGKLDLYFARSGPPGGNSWLDHRSSDPKGNYLFRNLGNFQFEDVTKSSHADGGRRSTFSAAWLDANDDGWPDLYVPNEFGDGVLLMNNRNGTFAEREISQKPADFGTMGLAVGDLDNDGRIDIYCNNMYSKAGTRVIGNMRPDTYPPKVMERLKRFVAGSQLHMNRGDLKFDQVGPEKKVAAVGWAYGVSLADFDNDGFLDIYATAGYVSRDRNEPDG